MILRRPSFLFAKFGDSSVISVINLFLDSVCRSRVAGSLRHQSSPVVVFRSVHGKQSSRDMELVVQITCIRFSNYVVLRVSSVPSDAIEKHMTSERYQLAALASQHFWTTGNLIYTSFLTSLLFYGHAASAPSTKQFRKFHVQKRSHCLPSNSTLARLIV